MLICRDVRTGAGCGAHYPSATPACLDPACGQSLRYALELSDPGAAVGDYRIIRLIDHGSFGAVYEAQHVAKGTRVALKETITFATSAGFQSELASLQQLSHPSLPTYFEVFEHDGHGYLAMEYVPGQSLEAVIGSTSSLMPEGQLLGYALQLCDALAYLHTASPPVLHRDIKPANVRITPEGLLKLVDFGLFKIGDNSTRHTVSGFGSPAYAPLEQYSGGTTVQSDIYSLGATLYHLATNIQPPSAMERFTAASDPLLPPRQINGYLSPAVSDAIVAALAQAQHDRPASAQSFKQALLGVAAVRPAPEVRPSAPPPGNPLGADRAPAAATIALPTVQRAWETWPVVMAESFRDNRNKWSVTYTDNEYMVGERRVGVGRLHFNVTSKQGMVTKSTPESLRELPRTPGFYVEAQMLRVAGAPQVTYGMLFARCHANDYYSFQMSDDQRYAMWVFRDSAWTTLIGWTYAPMIRQGKWNKLAALVQGPKISLMINDEYATDLENDELPGGSAGLLIDYNAEGLHGIVEFANFVVRAPGPA